MDRITKMLNKEEVAYDLGISKDTVDCLVETGWLHPIFLGKGWKFSQQEILEFQKLAGGLDIRNYTKMSIEIEKIKSAA